MDSSNLNFILLKLEKTSWFWNLDARFALVLDIGVRYIRTCSPIHVISKQMVSPSSYMERQAVLVNLAHKSLDNSSLQFLLANVSFHWKVPS
jgi:hypothetical protein